MSKPNNQSGRRIQRYVKGTQKDEGVAPSSEEVRKIIVALVERYEKYGP